MTEKRIEQFKEFFQRIHALRPMNQGARIHSVEGFFTSFNQYSLHPSSPRSFNLIDVLGVSNRETVHSEILAWLLNPRASHGQRDRFLRAFIEEAEVDIPSVDLTKCYVQSERQGYESIIDIAIWVPGSFIIHIENKIDHGEGEEQIERERRDLERERIVQNVKSENAFFVFLTRYGNMPETGTPRNLRTISYPDLHNAFKDVPIIQEFSKLSYFLNDLLAQYKRIGEA